VLHVPSVAESFMFTSPPVGCILHGTRGGAATRQAEFEATCNYVRAGANGLSWQATIFDGVIAIHLPDEAWGWNAKGASSRYLAVEFVQPRLGDEITDEQVQTFCYFFRTARITWPDLPLDLVAHSELDPANKSDPFPVDSPKNTELRRRIMACL
jgi:hypothetical protein